MQSIIATVQGKLFDVATGGLFQVKHFTVNPDVVANRVGDQVVIVHIKTDRIFSLNPTASRFWDLMSTGKSRDEIQSALLKEFRVSEEQLANEIDKLIASLKTEGILLAET